MKIALSFYETKRIDFRTWASSPLVTKGKTEELWLPRENVPTNDTAIFTILYLILLTLLFHKIFRLFFPKSSCWPETMYAEHWRWATL